MALLLVGPLLMAAGLILGRWTGSAADAPVWTDAQPPAAERIVAVPSMAPIVRRVRPGVVGVRVRVDSDAPADYGDDLGPGGEPRSGGVRSGSGFVVNDAGLIVTNFHLITDYVEIVVEVPDSGSHEALLVGVDPVTDIAVLRLEDPAVELQALELGDSSQLEQGDWLLAMGNPYQYRHSVTVGVVSYVGRHVPDQGMQVSNEYLQFSAPVNPGSSGGPVLDVHGHVVGVTTSTLGTGTGIAFAVPSKVLRWVLERAEEDGYVKRGYMGVSLVPVSSSDLSALGVTGGALINQVQPNTPASRAGLRSGDIVVRYGDRSVPDAYTLFDWITYGRPGQAMEVEVLRSDGRQAVAVQLGGVSVGAPPLTPRPMAAEHE